VHMSNGFDDISVAARLRSICRIEPNTKKSDTLASQQQSQVLNVNNKVSKLGFSMCTEIS
jgi:hypothetical protein